MVTRSSRHLVTYDNASYMTIICKKDQLSDICGNLALILTAQFKTHQICVVNLNGDTIFTAFSHI